MKTNEGTHERKRTSPLPELAAVSVYSGVVTDDYVVEIHFLGQITAGTKRPRTLPRSAESSLTNEDTAPEVLWPFTKHC